MRKITLKLNNHVHGEFKLLVLGQAVEEFGVRIGPIVADFRTEHQPLLGFPVDAGGECIIIPGISDAYPAAFAVPKPTVTESVMS